MPVFSLHAAPPRGWHPVLLSTIARAAVGRTRERPWWPRASAWHGCNRPRAGATGTPCIWAARYLRMNGTRRGFHGDHAPHGDRVLQLGRHVPAVTIVIDTPERIATAFDVIDELTSERGLVTSETIPALRATTGDRRRGGLRLATHHL